MTKFIVVWLIYISCFLFGFFGIEFKNNIFKLTRQLVTVQGSKKKILIILFVSIFLKMIALYALIDKAIPMYFDFPLLKQAEFTRCIGKIDRISESTSKGGSMSQTITIQGKRIDFFFNDRIIHDDEVYEVIYLPYSRYGVSLTKIE